MVVSVKFLLGRCVVTCLLHFLWHNMMSVVHNNYSRESVGPSFNNSANKDFALVMELQECLNPFKPEFTIVIFIHYKPRIAVAILDL